MVLNEALLFENSHILIVSAADADRQALVAMLSSPVQRFSSIRAGGLALQAIRDERPDLILLDARLPEMSAYEICRAIKADPDLAGISVIVLGAASDTGEQSQAFAAGASDYIGRPFVLEELRARLDTQLKLSRLQNDLAGQARKQVQGISNSQMSTIFAIAQLAEMRDFETSKHNERVQTLSRMLANHLMRSEKFKDQIDEVFVEQIFLASSLHDIGKIAIPDAVMNKKGALSAEEFDGMKQHTLIGARALGTVAKRHPENVFLKMGVEICRWHHERWDGSGYPDGLSGEAIPLSARITALADVYDALRSSRPYRAAFSHQEVCAILRNEFGLNFDPQILAVFLQFEQEFGALASKPGGEHA